MAALGLCCCVWAPSSCREWGLLSTCGARASHCAGFSLQSTSSRLVDPMSCASWALECGLQLLWHTGLVVWQHMASSRTRDRAQVPCIGKWILDNRATRKSYVLFSARLPWGYLFLRKTFSTHTCPKEVFTLGYSLSQFLKRIYTCIWTIHDASVIGNPLRAQRWLLALAVVIFSSRAVFLDWQNCLNSHSRLNPNPFEWFFRTLADPRASLTICMDVCFTIGSAVCFTELGLAVQLWPPPYL